VVVIDEAFDSEHYAALKLRLQSLHTADELEKAGIGTLQHYTIQEGVRGDFIHWIEGNTSDPAEAQFLNEMNEWRLQFNRSLYLNSSAVEFHFALYPIGSFYKRHLDQFKERSNRLLTFILYFNDDWTPDDQGELRVFHPNNEVIDIEPKGNRLVLFLSDKLEHEVRPTQAQRKSLTGWFLYQPEGLSFL